MNKTHFIFFIFFSVILHSLSFTQPINYKRTRCLVKTINIEDGLLNNSINDIVTDTFGFTWIATKTGLQRYNGYRLENIDPIIEKKIIDLNYGTFLFKTKNNMLLLTYKNGILIYNPYLNKFRRLISIPSFPNLFSPIKPLQENDEGIWCLQQNAGLVLYDLNGKLIKKIALDNDLIQQMNIDGRIRIAGNSNYIFITITSEKILQFNKNTSQYTILSFQDQTLDITCSESTLFRLSEDGLTAINIQNTSEKHQLSLEAFSENENFIGTIINSKKYGLLFSVNHHVLQTDSAFTQIKELTTLNDNPIISSGFINFIYPDKFNRIWLITNDDIKLIQNLKIPFQHYIYENAPNNFIRTIFFDEDKKQLLAGCFNGGLQLYDSSNNPLWESPLQTKDVKNIIGIEKINNDHYLIASMYEGLYYLTLSSKKIVPVFIKKENENIIHTHNILFSNDLQQLDDSSFILSTFDNVVEFHLQNDTLSNYKIIFHWINQNPLGVFCFTADKSLWIGSIGGIIYCVGVNGNIKILHAPENYSIRSMTKDINNNIWVGTDKGLFVYNENGRLLKSITIASGLLNDCIYSLLPDDKKSAVYAGSNLGISYVNLNGVIKNFTKETGLQANEFNTQCSIKSLSGRFYFGGINGITAFLPSEIFSQDDVPSIKIYELDVNDEKIKTDSSVAAKKIYTLPYDQNKINFSITTIGQQNASSYSYEYKMNGYDKYWIATNNAVNISYNLPPGDYQFEARLKEMNNVATTVFITIKPPFWKTWWFYILMAALLFLLAFLSFRAIYQKKYKSKVQALLVQQQIFTERERISRDLHDNIGAYATAISANVDEIIFRSKDKNNPAMQRLKESARDIIVHLRDSIWALNKENQTVEMLGDRIKNYVQKLQPFYSNILFDVQEKISQNTLLSSINALHLLRIIQEAIHNSIKHSGCNNIKIIISSDEIITIEIIDNGVGISEMLGSGEGIKNMKLRADEIKWKLILENKFPGCCVKLTGRVLQQ